MPAANALSRSSPLRRRLSRQSPILATPCSLWNQLATLMNPITKVPRLPGATQGPMSSRRYNTRSLICLRWPQNLLVPSLGFSQAPRDSRCVACSQRTISGANPFAPWCGSQNNSQAIRKSCRRCTPQWSPGPRNTKWLVATTPLTLV